MTVDTDCLRLFTLYWKCQNESVFMDVHGMWNRTQLNWFMLLHGLSEFCKMLQKICTVINNSFKTFIIDLHKTGGFVLVLHHTQKSILPFCSVTITAQCIPASFVLGFLNPVYRHFVVLLGWKVSLSQSLCIHSMAQTQKKHIHTPMLWVEFKTMIPVFGQYKIIHASDCVARRYLPVAYSHTPNCRTQGYVAQCHFPLHHSSLPQSLKVSTQCDL